MDSIESRCLAALQRAWAKGVESPRSPRKLDILHGWLREELLQRLPGFEIFGKTEDDSQYSREIRVDGKYYRKRVDLLIARDGHHLGVISVKFVLSSYKKNAINYFEHQLGETANLRGQRLIYGNVMFLPDPIPLTREEEYFGSGILKTESVNSESVRRYARLCEDHDNIVVPDVQALVIAILDKTHDSIVGLATEDDLSYLDERSRRFLLTTASISKFIRDYSMKVSTSYRTRLQ